MNNNEFYQNAMINIRKDNDEWKNAAGTCSANMIEKAITKNGEYNAKEDGADGYSNVNVAVASPPDFSMINIPGLPKNLTLGLPNAADDTNRPTSIWVSRSSTGIFTLPERKIYGVDSLYVICFDPVVSVKGFYDSYYDNYVIFTPAPDYDGMYPLYGSDKIKMGGATVTPGDGKVYCAYVRYISTQYGTKYWIEKYDIDFSASIN